MLLETERLRIRRFEKYDAEDLYEILGDSETMKYLEPPYTLEKTRKFLHSFCMERQGAAAAECKVTGKMIGYILFSAVGENEYEIGWIFNRSFWRKGYAGEACEAVIRYAFSQKNAHRIFAETIDADKSVGLMKKLGMKPEKVEKNGAKDRSGKRVDLYVYSITGEEYAKE